MNEFEFNEDNHRFIQLMSEYMEVISDMVIEPRDWGDSVIFSLAATFDEIQQNGKIDIKKLNKSLEVSIQNARAHRSQKVG